MTLGIDLSCKTTSSAQSFPFLLPMVTASVNKLPPNLGLSSANITLAPFFAAAKALESPDGPEPTTNMSQYSYLCSYLSGSGFNGATPRPAALLIIGSYILYQKFLGHIKVL